MTGDPRAQLPRRVVFVVGATAVGKTDLAASLARTFDGEIVGADSRQVYRFMDVATAKPSRELRAEIPHYMVDIVDPDDPFDAARWRIGALEALTRIATRGKVAIVCGGTGLYVRSLLYGLFSGPARNASVRSRLEAEERAEPGSLRARLVCVDPVAAERIHPNDLVRTVRALEVLELTGRRLSEWHAEHGLSERLFDALVIEPTMPRPRLHERIAERSIRMTEAGLLDEVRLLRERGYSRKLPAFAAIGYREATDCLDGLLDPSDLAGAITVATRRYARRQLVWLRGQLATERVEAGAGARATALVERFLARGGFR